MPPMINQYKSFMFGMNALPHIGDLARQVDKGIPYLSTGLKVVPLLAPAYIEPAMAKVGALGTVSMGLKAAPHIANVASTIAKNVDNVLPVGSFGELTTISRFKSSGESFNR